MKSPRDSNDPLSHAEEDMKVPTGALYERYRQRVLLGTAVIILFFVGLVGILRTCSSRP